MAEFAEVVRNRRMTRAFGTAAVDPAVIDDMVDLASRAPSAGKAQGWHLVVLAGDDTAVFWDTTLPAVRRDSFRWKQLLSAPVIALPFADAKAYTDRYAEPDKIQTGLGAGTEAWPAPYWTIDASMSVMTLLLAAENVGLGALFFGVFRGERELRQVLGIPPGLELLGALAIGHPAPKSGDDTDPGRSADRRRRQPGEIIHRGRW